MKYFILFLLILNFISIVSADCQGNQVDINSASTEELEKLNGIGPVYAGRIIEDRPFESVEDLIRISGIGEKTLEKIKLQDIACVDGEAVEVEEIAKEPLETIEKKKDVIVLIPQKEKIVLNGAVENSGEVVYESKNSKILKYTPYAFSIFLIFVIVVMIFDK
ncbi:helix-hairpin-helix domain-containing protein [Candidatus Pacearchaeota archaeon]|nr:helix-hairpin-helix domain-containing protein [Candidatus Pacearchaeota archaeon]